MKGHMCIEACEIIKHSSTDNKILWQNNQSFERETLKESCRVPADVLRTLLCHRQPLQVAASLQPRGGPGLQREEEDGGPTSHLRPVRQRLPIHAHRYRSSKKQSCFLSLLLLTHLFSVHRSGESVCPHHVSVVTFITFISMSEQA